MTAHTSDSSGIAAHLTGVCAGATANGDADGARDIGTAALGHRHDNALCKSRESAAAAQVARQRRKDGSRAGGVHRHLCVAAFVVSLSPCGSGGSTGN